MYILVKTVDEGKDIRREENIMCNLGQGIEDNVNAKVIMNMYRKGYTYEQMAEIVEKSIDDVEAIIKKENLY